MPGRAKAAVLLLAVCVSAVAADNQPHSSEPRVLRVGASHQIKTIAGAATLARDGDIVEIESGEYPGDVAVWTQKALTIRGVGGRPMIIANGEAAEAKAIWVVRGGTIAVENIAFSGARVPDRNGAGIRHERGRLTVRDCVFTDNENGILASNDPGLELEVEDSEFVQNGAGNGYSHGIYAGAIKRLSVRGSWFHAGRVGHLIKSRAAESLIQYNRIADDIGGTSSYELEFPNGGRAVVVGNFIQQSAQTQNPVLVSFGAEGYSWPTNALYLAHNTLVNDRPQGGIFVAALPGKASVRAVNNVLVGKGSLELQVPAETVGNRTLEWADFVLPQRLDYRLKASSKAVGAANDPGGVDDMSLRPTREYRHPASSVPVPPETRLSPGAFQVTPR